MNRKDFIYMIDEKLKLVRHEQDYTQDKMADIIGMSKKTLIQIEKGRATLGWSGAVVLCSIFKDSNVLAMTFGGQPQDLILTLAFDNTYERHNDKTFGGKIWWNDIEVIGKFKIQKNIISQHYRILDQHDHRICSSFDSSYIRKRLQELAGSIGGQESV